MKIERTHRNHQHATIEKMTEVIDASLATAGKSCNLGNDPSKYSEKFEDWYDHTSLLADSIGVKNEKQKLSLILLWGGRHFRKHAKDAGVITVAEITTAASADELNGAIEKFANILVTT